MGQHAESIPGFRLCQPPRAALPGANGEGMLQQGVNGAASGERPSAPLVGEGGGMPVDQAAEPHDQADELPKAPLPIADGPSAAGAAGDGDVTSMILRLRTQLAGKKKDNGPPLGGKQAKDKQGEAEKQDAEFQAEVDEVALETPMKRINRKSKGSDKVPKTKKTIKKSQADCDKANDEALKFVGTGYCKPRYYKGSTIYTDSKKGCWRLKLSPGDLHEKYYRFSNNPKTAWSQLMNMAITHNKSGDPGLV
jgi:hypothetical protein